MTATICDLAGSRERRRSAFVRALRSTLGETSSPVHLHEPEFGGKEWAYLKDCLETGWVSSAGRYVDRFEEMLAEYTGARNVVCVASGTAALHISLKLAGVGEGDEVLVPTLSFVATANAVAHCGAVPHFVDSSRETLGLDPLALDDYLKNAAEFSSGGLRNRASGRRIAAVVPMHTFGHPVSMGPLLDLASRLNLPVVEDAAESLGSRYRGQHTGTFGRLGILSFNGNKVITTGGGGAVLTDDQELADQAKHLTTTAKQAHRWRYYHDEVAWNYRMPNLNAAVGCAQMEQLPLRLEMKRELAETYRRAFDGSEGLSFVGEPTDCESNYWLNAVSLEEPNMAERDALLDAAHESGFNCRPAWTLLSKLPMFQECPSAPIPVAESLEASLICVPSSAKSGAKR